MNEFKIKLDDGTVIPWEYKKIQRPSILEVLKVLKYLDGASAKTMAESIVSGADAEEASRLVPFVLNENQSKKDKPTLYAMWVLSCFWYFSGGGPKPAMPKVQKRKKKEKQYWYNDNLQCPLCGRVWVAEKVYTDKGSALPDFAKWLLKHSKECEKRGG